MDTEKNRTASYTLDLTEYAEGPIYVRAIAADFDGNRSDSSPSAPFVQYIVDRTPPAAPTGVSAEGGNGAIEVRWIRGDEADLGKYSVYRSTSQDSEFQIVASALMTLNYVDRNANDELSYYYTRHNH